MFRRNRHLLIGSMLILSLLCLPVMAADFDSNTGQAAVWTTFRVSDASLASGVMPLIQIHSDAQPLLSLQWEEDASSWFGVTWYVRIRSAVPLNGRLIAEQIWTQVPTAGHEYEFLASYDALLGDIAVKIIDRTAVKEVASDVIHIGSNSGVNFDYHIPAEHTVIAQTPVSVPLEYWRFAVDSPDDGYRQVNRVVRSDQIYIVTQAMSRVSSGTFRLVDVADGTTVFSFPAGDVESPPIVPVKDLAYGLRTYCLEYAEQGDLYWPLGLQELAVLAGSVHVGFRDVRVIDGQVEGMLIIQAQDVIGDIRISLNAAVSTWRFRGALSNSLGERANLWTEVVQSTGTEKVVPFSFPAPVITTDELSLVCLTLSPQVNVASGSLAVSTVSQEAWYYAQPAQEVPATTVVYADRKAAAQRERRMIYNNDGLDNPGTKINPVTFLSRRTVGFEKTMVDAIFYCDGIFNLYTHTSTETELLNGPGTTRPEWEPWAWELQRQGFDTLQLVIEYAKANDLEVFWSFRMNDTHDNQSSRQDWQLSQWKRDNAHYMMSPYRRQFPYGWAHGPSWTYTALNYEYEAVREKAFRIIEDVVRRYDIDGLELDFLRFPVFFKPQMMGEPVTDAQRALMTEWLQRVREMVDAVAAQRGRPILIAVRVHDSVEYNYESGMDLGTWLEKDLVDLVVASDYFRLQPWEHIVSFVEPYGVPVYACVSAARFPADNILPWRAEALRAWEAGAAGIYTFNIFRASHAAFSELGDPDLLLRLPRSDHFEPTTDNLRNVAAHRTFLRGGERFLHPEVAATYPQYFGEQ
ncbi:MAG TPA: hypothetical protein GXZ82_14695 [Firmicutes bacterium]|jgi:hypothetical protein|nr:hypothetical protein [Bacillota bacterium]